MPYIGELHAAHTPGAAGLAAELLAGGGALGPAAGIGLAGVAGRGGGRVRTPAQAALPPACSHNTPKVCSPPCAFGVTCMEHGSRCMRPSGGCRHGEGHRSLVSGCPGPALHQHMQIRVMCWFLPRR